MDRRALFTLGRRGTSFRGPAGASASAAGPAGSLEPWRAAAGDGWDYAEAAHLLRRSMIGPLDAEIRRAVDEGLDATIARLLAPFEPSFYLIDDWVRDTEFEYFPPEEGPLLEVWLKEKLRRRERLARWWLKTLVDSP